MATRVAAVLKKERDVRVETVKGGLGEFSVLVDAGRRVAFISGRQYSLLHPLVSGKEQHCSCRRVGRQLISRSVRPYQNPSCTANVRAVE